MPVDLDLRLVRYFVVTAHEENVGRAAELLLVAQPSLSRQLTRLESQVGVRLLERTPRGSRLTDAGRAFLVEAEALLRAADRARSAARRAAEPRELTVGLRAYLIVTPAVSQMRRRHPEAVLRSITIAMHETQDALLDRRIDVAVSRMPFAVEGLSVTDLYREPRALVVPNGHRFAERREIGWSEFADEPLVRQSDDVVDAYWRLDPRPDGSAAPDGPLVASTADKYELVAQGQALAIAPDVPGATGQRDDLRRIPITDIPATRVVIATRSSESSPLVAEFVRLVGQLCRPGRAA